MCLKLRITVQHVHNTVKTLKRGHFGTAAFVLCSEVVLLLEVALYNPLELPGREWIEEPGNGGYVVVFLKVLQLSQREIARPSFFCKDLACETS